jgi:hypothetical protein
MGEFPSVRGTWVEDILPDRPICWQRAYPKKVRPSGRVLILDEKRKIKIKIRKKSKRRSRIKNRNR